MNGCNGFPVTGDIKATSKAAQIATNEAVVRGKGD